MIKPIEKKSLELDEQLHFQQVLFVVRTIGLLLLIAGLLAALAGVLGGNGPLAQAHASAGPLQATWPRFSRYQMPTRFEFEVDTAAIPGDTFDVTFDGEHARKFSFEDILPQPKEVAAADGRVRYTFNVAPGERQLVILQGQPETMGWLSGTVAFANRPPLPIDSFVYP